MSQLTKLSFLLLPLVFGYENAFSWGKVGHEAVAEIAKDQLLPQVSNKIQNILGQMDMTDAANWPDKIKGDPIWKHASPYHYLAISDGSDYFSQLESLSSSQKKAGDVLRGLVKAEDILRSSKTSRDEKAWALSFMIHFMGDLHQPLHTGRPEDKGGNSVTLKYFNKSTNLHAVWDSGIISALLRAPRLRVLPETDAFLSQIRTPTQSEILQWQNSYIMDWTMESYDFRLDGVYSGWNNNSVYQKKYAPLLNERILRAGYRLAAWLNAIFTNKKFQSAKAAEIRSGLVEVLGSNHGNDIILNPKRSTKRELQFFESFDHEHDH